ncbi:MAG: transglycosylase SLT domain-containing protein, partial [Ignavibacteria bacterium]|nr:transglycosylase SLT domain-containing protein [Ignavibacteria bacterium]
MNFYLTDKFLKYTGALAVLLLFVGIIISFIRFSDTETLNKPAETKSDNPDAVISPAENHINNKKTDYIKTISTNNAITIEAFVYDWQNIFDIFAYNKINGTGNTESDSFTTETIKKIIINPNKRFSKSSSDAILAEYGNVILEEAEYYKIDWRLIIAMIKQESAFKPEAVSHAGAYGFMQIMPRTGSMLEKTLMLEDHRSPENNLRAGIYYFAMLVGRYHGAGDTNRIKLALAAYNSGPGRIEDAMAMAY